MGSFIDAIGRLFATILEWILVGFVRLIDLLPLPFDGTVVVNLVDSIPDSIWYFASVFQIQTGATIVVGSYLARFILRRIPFIGG